jgi:hypothetical protein
MRYLRLSFVYALAIMLIACGSGSSSSSNVGGNWSATLTAKGSTVLVFSALLTQGSSTQISVSNLTFTMATTCFTSGSTASSTYSAAGSTGVPPNTFQMTVESGMSNLNGTNMLTLQGTLANGAISGTWNETGTGSGCTGTGNFSMFKM